MATGEKWSAQPVATSFDSGDIMSVVQSGDNKQVDHDVLMDDPQICKAWVNFDGTTNTAGKCTIRGSYNVVDVDDNGTGDYTINFINALSDANYSVGGMAGSTGGISALLCMGHFLSAVDSVRIGVTFQNAGNSDADNVNVQIFGS